MAENLSRPGSDLMKSTLIRDPIHGSLELHPLLLKIIKTPAFHRLKYIKQLSGLHYVYPGATHTRYEHSIGVAYLAGKYARMLQRRYKEVAKNDSDYEITDDEVLCIEIAGLCHDLGHGPFSHLFDKVLKKHKKAEDKKVEGKKSDFVKKHEQVSTLILETDRELRRCFDEYGITEEQIKDIKIMINPPKPLDKIKGRKKFLYEIVANKTTGIDVDKWDYFIRDCHYMGLHHEFDYQRLMQMSRIMKFKDKSGSISDDLRLCYNDREIPSIMGMFRTRYSLHEKAYQHRRGIAVGHMLLSAMHKVQDIELIAYTKDGGESEKMVSIRMILQKLRVSGGKQAAEGVEAYLKLNDGIIHIIENKDTQKLGDETQKSKLKEAKKLLCNLHNDTYFHRIDPKETGETALQGKGSTQSDESVIISEIKKISADDEVLKDKPNIEVLLRDIKKEISEDHIFSTEVELSYGSERKEVDNPCEGLLVYNEFSEQPTARKLEGSELDNTLKIKSFGKQMTLFWFYSRLDEDKDVIIARAIKLIRQ